MFLTPCDDEVVCRRGGEGVDEGERLDDERVLRIGLLLPKYDMIFFFQTIN